MFKTLNQYWTLEDEEFTVTVVSPVNLLQAPYMERLADVLERYDLREIKTKKIDSSVSYPEQFPDLAYGCLYYIEAKLGMMPGYERIRQDIYSFLQINPSKIFVSEDGSVEKEKEAVVDPKAVLDIPEESAFDVQAGVGETRAKKITDYLKKTSEERKKRQQDRDKVFVTNHTALKEHFNKGFTKGFYKCRLSGTEIVVEQKVKDWPKKVEFVAFSSGLTKLVETSAKKDNLLNEFSIFEEKTDYKYLIENACSQVMASCQAGMGNISNTPQGTPQPEYKVEEKSDTEFEVKWPNEMVLMDQLQKLLGQFDARIQSLSLSKSEGDNPATYLSLSVCIGEPAKATQTAVSPGAS